MFLYSPHRWKGGDFPQYFPNSISGIRALASFASFLIRASVLMSGTHFTNSFQFYENNILMAFLQRIYLESFKKRGRIHPYGCVVSVFLEVLNSGNKTVLCLLFFYKLSISGAKLFQIDIQVLRFIFQYISCLRGERLGFSSLKLNPGRICALNYTSALKVMEISRFKWKQNIWLFVMKILLWCHKNMKMKI